MQPVYRHVPPRLLPTAGASDQQFLRKTLICKSAVVITWITYVRKHMGKAKKLYQQSFTEILFQLSGDVTMCLMPMRQRTDSKAANPARGKIAAKRLTWLKAYLAEG